MIPVQFQARRVAAAALVVLLMAVAAVVSVLWRSSVAAADPSLNEVQAQVRQLQTQMRNADENVNRARDALDDSQKRQADLESQLGGLQKNYDDTSAKVGKLGAAAYQNGGNLSTGSILATGTPQNMLDELSYIDVINAQNSKLLKEYKAAKKQLEGTKKKFDDEVAKQKDATATAESQKATLQAEFDKWQKLWNKLSPNHGIVDGITGTYDGSASGLAVSAVKFAYAQLGKSYVFGAAGPDSYDCSGLTEAAWRTAGVSLPHSARQQYNTLSGRRVSLNALLPGDLLFFYSGISHVGIYIGGGRMIHAPEPGEPVRIQKVPVSGMPIEGAARPG